MPNPIKYSTGAESLALKKGNFYIGTGDVGKGPSDTTGYYQGPNVPTDGYVIYLNNAGQPGNLSYHIANNDSELISFTNELAGASYTTANECLVYYAGQSDKVCVNKDYEGIVTDGLVLNLDAGFIPSYPTTGSTWYNVSNIGSNNGTLTNGPTYSTDGSGSIVFDGSDDYATAGSINFNTSASVEFWVKKSSLSVNKGIVGFDNSNIHFYFGGSNSQPLIAIYSPSVGYGPSILSVSTEWVHGTVTISPEKTVVYKDGGELTASSTNYIYNPSGVQNIIIAAYPSTNQRIDGQIASVKIYNRELSPEEVLQNYNAQKGRFGL